MLQTNGLVEFEMAVTKATVSDSGAMRIRMVSSDTGEDCYGERMSLELYRDFVERINNGYIVEEPYASVLREKSGWIGGMPYVSLSHFKSGVGGANIPADTEKVYVDGDMLKSLAVCRNTPLGIATFNALKRDLEGKSDLPKIRVSIGFLDLEHRHGDFVFTRKGLESHCPMCENGDGDKVYLKGILVHNALTRVPANPRTEAQIEESMTITTKLEDVESIVGEELAKEVLKNRSAIDDVDDNLLVVRAEPAVDEEEDETHPEGCNCKACSSKKEVDKSDVSDVHEAPDMVVTESTAPEIEDVVDVAFSTLKAKIASLSGADAEAALTGLQNEFDALAMAVRSKFTEKQEKPKDPIETQLAELSANVNAIMASLSALSGLKEEITILKSQIAMGNTPVVPSPEPVRRSIQVERSAPAPVGFEQMKPRSIREIARASVQ